MTWSLPKRFALSLLLLPLGVAAACATPLEFSQLHQAWEGQTPGTVVGTCETYGAETSATRPVVSTGQAFKGKRSVSFAYNIGARPAFVSYEAEKATTSGCVIFNDAAASGKMVGAFGEAAGDSIRFPSVASGASVRVFFSNDIGTPKRCSVYSDGTDVANVFFEDTDGWSAPFHDVSVATTVSAPLMLRVDADDRAWNQNTFCCNVDRIVVGAARVDARLDCPLQAISPVMTDLRFAIRARAGLTYRIALEDQASIRHFSPTLTQTASDQWETRTIPLHTLAPLILPETPGLQVGAVWLQILTDIGTSVPLDGTVFLDDLRFAAKWSVWPSTPPIGCPLAKSADITAIAFTGRHREYTNADTWYPTWADNDMLYSPFTDGWVEGVNSLSAGAGAVTGNARIEGSHPLDLRIVPLGASPASPSSYGGRYPCASLFHNGVWYYGTYCVDPPGWNVLGPFVGFRYSTNYGQTWTTTSLTPENSLFQESGKNGAKVKMGAPHFVDFGRDMEHSPDGKAYLVAHGASRPGSADSWVSGEEVYLARVTPTTATINSRSQYEFYGGKDSGGKPIWTSNFARIRPLFTWPSNAGCVTATYDAPLRKYLMCVTWGGPDSNATFDTYILESDALTGPWKLVTYMSRFGEQGYFANFPSKFISANGKTLWLSYSANYTNGFGTHWQSSPPGGKYAMCLQEVRLFTPGDTRTKKEWGGY